MKINKIKSTANRIKTPVLILLAIIGIASAIIWALFYSPLSIQKGLGPVILWANKNLSNKKDIPRVIVLGFDGAQFDFIDSLINEGHLPNFAKLKSESSHGTLSTVKPPILASAWPAMTTGQRVGNHGVYSFKNKIPGTYGEFAKVDATTIDCPFLWDVASASGINSCVMNIPMTYPPHPFNGIMVTSGWSHEDPDFTFPRFLAKDLDRIGYQRQIHGDKSMERYIGVEDFRMKTARHLMNSIDFNLLFVMSLHTDICMHLFTMKKDLFKYSENLEEKYVPLWNGYSLHDYETIKTIYSRADRMLGEFLNILRDDDILFVVSDHGTEAKYRLFKTSNFLIKEGYLVLKDDFKFDKEGAHDLWKNWNESINWQKTTAWSSVDRGIEINTKGIYEHGIVEPGDEYNILRNEIIGKLMALQDPVTKLTPFRSVIPREKLFFGKHMKDLPDLYIDIMPGYSFDEATINKDLKIFNDYSYSGHSSEGVVFIKGAPFKKNHKIAANICDVAPTVLYLLNSKIPAGMDGEVIKSAFSPDHLVSHPIKFTDKFSAPKNHKEKSAEKLNNDDIDKLRSLGYL